jgi:hypothetical protein
LTVLPERIPPVVSVVPPPDSGRLLHPAVVVDGTASDNSRVREVLYRLNAGPWLAADGTTQWRATLDLRIGANELQVKAIDEFDNESPLKSLSLVQVAADWIRVEVTGQGAVKPDYDGQRLELGKDYTLTALPATGYVFSNWTGSMASSEPTLAFRMESNRVFQAHFVPDPYPAWKGTYNGLFAPPPPIDQPTSALVGAFILTVSDRGVASGKLIVAGKSLPFSGVRLDLVGAARFLVKRPTPQASLDIQILMQGTAGPGVLRGQVVAETSTVDLLAVRQQPTTEWKGMNTFLAVFETTDPAMSPPGNGPGTLSVDAQGRWRIVGTLGDGSPFTAAGVSGPSGQFPVYVPLYSGKGLMWGWGQLLNPADRRVSAALTWHKPATGNADPYYPAGFTVTGGFSGSAYQPPPRGQPVLNWSQGQCDLRAGNLAHSWALPVQWSNNQLVVVGDNPPRLGGAINPSTGLLQASLVHPETGKTTAVKGAVVQSTGMAAGWFLGTNQGGLFLVRPGAVGQP